MAANNILTELKEYTEKDLENIFFRPILTGESAEELGIKVMYNTPVPTTMHYWSRSGNVLATYQRGFQGGDAATQKEKVVPMTKLKAEVAFSPEDYFSTVYENITNRAEVNLQDLTGSELENAETQLFRESIAESIRMAMWLGIRDDENEEQSKGILTWLFNDSASNHNTTDLPIPVIYLPQNAVGEEFGATLLANAWDNAYPVLRQSKNEGQLAFFVTSDVYDSYEKSLNGVLLESSFAAMQNGRTELKYNGIPVIDLKLNNNVCQYADFISRFVLLADRRNLAVAVNTRDFPGTEVRMWYNPDEIENRQRAVFMFGATYLLPELVSLATCNGNATATQTAATTVEFDYEEPLNGVGRNTVTVYNAQGAVIGSAQDNLQASSVIITIAGEPAYLEYSKKAWGAGYNKFKINVTPLA